MIFLSGSQGEVSLELGASPWTLLRVANWSTTPASPEANFTIKDRLDNMENQFMKIMSSYQGPENVQMNICMFKIRPANIKPNISMFKARPGNIT